MAPVSFSCSECPASVPEDSFMGGDQVVSSKENFIEIGSVLVNPDIFSRVFICDVGHYKCSSQCCYRACIVPEHEAKRVEKHFDDILSYLGPENREILKKNGTILADCGTQCAYNCEIHEDEARAIKRAFGGTGFRCVLIFNNICSLLHTNAEGFRYCAVHSYALDKGLVWDEFKFSDCVQYPLSFYHNEAGKQVLSIQDTPYLEHIPCMQQPMGEPMYKSLRRTIEIFLGKDFYEELASWAEKNLR